MNINRDRISSLINNTYEKSFSLLKNMKSNLKQNFLPNESSHGNFGNYNDY